MIDKILIAYLGFILGWIGATVWEYNFNKRMRESNVYKI